MAADHLKKLHTALVDTRGAYELAAKETEDAQIASVCKEMIAIRRTDHEQLHGALVTAGETPDDDGSFMMTVHETVVAVRAAFTGIGKKALPAFVSGEEDILKLYDEAIAESADAGASDILRRQRARLTTEIAKMRALAVQS
ncbi:MAG: PA2169 family four-helix-bundle protein [Hyphomicrobium sp.]|jgi:uncharacterized protein (TIGR02284 family)